MTDPFAVLGVAPTASLDEIRAARRRLAQQVHPDHGGDEVEMRRVNVAFEAAVAHVTGRRPLAEPPPSSSSSPPEPEAARSASTPGPTPRYRSRGMQRDEPSFTMNVLPVEAFEAILVASSWLGELVVDDPPYLAEVLLAPPHACWCRLDIVPDAGGSTVTLTVAAADGASAPDVEEIRDVWVMALNELGRRGVSEQPPPW